jgi:hypothetical protein
MGGFPSQLHSHFQQQIISQLVSNKNGLISFSVSIIILVYIKRIITPFQSPSWEANSHSASQENSPPFIIINAAVMWSFYSFICRNFTSEQETLCT